MLAMKSFNVEGLTVSWPKPFHKVHLAGDVYVAIAIHFLDHRLFVGIISHRHDLVII